ncbi:MAG: hypothetical protein Q9209_006215 [Squamulea sp. 1 TL-2023]
MHTTSLLPLALLSLPLLSSATPQGPPANNPAPVTPQPNPTPQQPTTTLSPAQRNAQYDSNYASLASSATTDPSYLAFASGLAAASIPNSLASAQEASYIAALRTATGPVPEPAYITALPQAQQSWIRGFHQRLNPAVSTAVPSSSVTILPPASTTLPATNATQGGIVVNGTTVASGQPTAPGTSGLMPPPPPPTATADPGNGTNGTNETSGAMSLGEAKSGLWGMVGMGLVGTLGAMILL